MYETRDYVAEERHKGLDVTELPLPLSGVRILDLTHVLAGPYATMILADLGAEIIKVEQPGVGDGTRAIAPHVNGESSYFMSMNRNKESITLNLASDVGRELLLKLVGECDAVIENFRPGVMAKLGLTDEVLLAANPSVILCSISGFGKLTDVPDPRPAFDISMQGKTGLMSVNGFAEGPPTRLGIPIGDLSTGLFAAIGISAGLAGRRSTSKGRRVDVSMYRGMVSLLGYMAGYYFATGESPGRVGNGHHTVGPLGVFHAKDGDLVIGVMTQKFWVLFTEALGHPELQDEPHFKRPNDRVRNLEELRPYLNKYLSERNVAEWEVVLTEIGVPHSKIRSVGEVLEDPYSIETGLVQSVEHPTVGTWRVLGPVLQWPGSQRNDLTPPPLLGEQTSQILQRILGLDSEALATALEATVPPKRDVAEGA